MSNLRKDVLHIMFKGHNDVLFEVIFYMCVCVLLICVCVCASSRICLIYMLDCVTVVQVRSATTNGPFCKPIFTACKRSCGKVMFLYLSVIIFTWGSLSGGGSLSRGVSVQGGLCPEGVSVQRGISVEGFLSRGSLSRGSLSRGSLSKEVSVQGLAVQGSPIPFHWIL